MLGQGSARGGRTRGKVGENVDGAETESVATDQTPSWHSTDQQEIEDLRARIDEFEELPSKSFACYSEILGILADGSIVPCCLAYDDKIALGNIKHLKLKDVLDNNQFIKNLRSYEGKKHEVCKKCFGEPTKRGVVFRTIYNQFKRLIGDKN